MSIETKYTCDVCGAVRGATNHWFLASAGSGAYIIPWNRVPSKEIHKVAAKHLCGQACAHKFLDQFFTGLDANRHEDVPIVLSHGIVPLR